VRGPLANLARRKDVIDSGLRDVDAERFYCESSGTGVSANFAEANDRWRRFLTRAQAWF
jgi:hypothetical protein